MINEDPTNLTLARFLEVQQQFEAHMAAVDADAFIRLGADAYQGYRILKRGGLVIVGGSERPESRGAQIVAQLREMAPELRIRMSEYLPDGEIYLLDDSRLWS